MYKITVDPKLELIQTNNGEKFSGIEYYLFVSSLRELYVLCILLLNKNSCFYEKIKL